jgi:hypothetical protein
VAVTYDRKGDGTTDDLKTIQSNTQQDDAILEKYGIISNDSGRHGLRLCATLHKKAIKAEIME